MASYRVLSPGDRVIETVVPGYSETLDLIVDILATSGPPVSILDLGAGPGRISEVLAQAFPEAHCTLLDQSPEILEVARGRLTGADASFVVGDFTTVALGSDYSAIVAGLTLHHLDDDGKQKMAARLWGALAEGGTLLISDIVRASTPAWDRRYEDLWLRRLEQLPAEESAYIRRHYLEQDHPASVEENLRWLQALGFVEVACHWRYLNFAVWSGRKPAVG